MTVDITQEEMNILNLNGITADEVRDNIQYMRGTGLDDDAIRNQYSNTINELRPITKISPDDTAKIKAWQDKGGITPFEYASRKAVEFNGTYDNIDNNANMSKMEDTLINSKRNQAVDERIANIEKKKAERNKRVNEGTASFLDRLGAAMDRIGEASYQAQIQDVQTDPVLIMAGVDNQGNPLHPDKFDKSKSINFHESLGNSFMAGGWIPFVGGFIEKADDKKQREIQEHILKGEPIREDELKFLNHQLEKQKEEAVRGYTLGGNVAHDFLPSLVRFGGEIASGGWVLKSLGLSAELAEGASLAEKVAHGVKSMAASGAVNTVLPTSWNDTYANYQGRLLEKGMELTDKGTWIFKESDEKPAISFLKSLGSTFTMFASESSGELLGIPIKGATGIASKYISTPISKYLASNPKLIKFIDNTIPALSKAYEKLNNLPIKGKNIDWLKSAVKYDGFIEELGEEIVEDVMNLTLGTTDEKRTLENYSKAIFKSPDEWAVIAGAVALQGGTLSVASHVLGSYMERNGATDEQIIETLNNLTEGEKEQKIQELINENLINVSGYTNEESEKKSQLKDAYYEQIKKTGMNDDEALNNATLMSEAFAALAKNTGMNLDDVTNEANIVIQNMSDEQAQQQYEADNSAALNGRVVFNDSQLIDDELQKVYNDFDALPEDYDNEDDLNNRIMQMQILQDVKDGTLSEENQQAAQDLIAQYEQTNPQLAAALRDAMNNKSNNLDDGIQEVEFQKIDRNNIESAFGDTVENIQDTVKADIMNILQENGIEESEFNFEDIRIFGSYSTGKNKKGSDLDLLVQYSGDMREDDAFNMLNAEKLSIYDKNGKKVKIDINPINTATSGTIDEHLDYLDNLEPKFQKIDTAGAENNQTALARQEWKKKGTESRFFKKWFGDSKVVDENGKPLVVYHGSPDEFEIFNSDKTLYGEVSKGFNFFTNKKSAYQNSAKDYAEFAGTNGFKRNGKIYETYLSIKKPLHIQYTSNGMSVYNGETRYSTPVEYYDANYKQIKEEYLKGNYDGIIIENTDKNNDDSVIYLVPKSEQIKSVDNRGTFDENNPNIYYQSAAMKRSKFADFEDFYNDVISKPKNTKNKEQFNYLTKGGINLRIPHDTILHEQKKHKLSSDEWKDLLDNIDDVSDAALSKKKSRFDGKPVLLKVNTLTNTYGVVLETFEKSNPIIATAFIDSEKNIDNWIKNEAISSGTKTSFLSNRLNNIITNIHPKFKSYNVQAYFQSAYHGTPHRFDEFSTDNIGTGEGAQAHGWGLYFAADKNISEIYRKNLVDGYSAINTLKYKGKTINNETLETVLYKLKSDSFEEALRYINNKIDYYGKRYKNAKEKYPNSAEYLKNEKSLLDKAINIKNSLNEIDINDIKLEQGQLFEVDIPEDDVLLDEQKPFSKQPEKVQKALRELAEEYTGLNDEFEYDQNGEAIYKYLSYHAGSQQDASMELNDVGIKGITYNGHTDGKCYVIFDDKAINVLKTYYQGTDNMNSNIENARGFTYQRKNFDGTEKENLIVLLNKKADKSTLMHEFAHVYLITLNNLAQHNDRAKELLMTVNKWLHYDGVEYTEFQHERFANNFVAYVKSGKAPSYGLKRVFENFRKWLNDMYSTLQATDDIFITPETEEVFDELLGNISINAQKQEAQEIINKAHNNAIRRYTDDVEQLKRKFKKNQLTEYQKRYRDTALSIVHYALTNSGVPEAKKYRNYNQLQMILLATPEFKKKNKGVSKQQEEIGEILAEIDDVFSGTNGFLDEWSEFFSDTGISYDNQEVGADAELATQAFNVLVNHEYAEANPDYSDGQFGELTAQEKAQTEYELEYIIEEYKNADDKTIPLIAYNEWSKKVHPYIEEDIQKEWERQTNEIDRYQALNKFEQAKEDLKLYAAALVGHGDYSSQFAEYARAIVKRLDFMTESDKAKLFDKLKEFNSFREIQRNLDDVMDYAQTLADVSDRKALAEQIDREVRQTIHVWQNGIKKTKYTYPANKLFERLREINKMSSEAVQDMYDAILNEEEQPEYTSDEVHDKEYYSLIEELFIKYKINGIWYNSTEFLQDLLERLQTAKYTAKVARDEIDFERRMKQLNLVDECARAVNQRKDEIQNNPKIKKIGKLNSLGFNFNGALRMIFNDKIKNWASFDYLYAQRDAQVGKDRREFLDKAKKIFGYEGKLANVKLFNRFIDMTQKYYKINQRHSPDIEQGSYRVTQQSPETGYNATQYTQQIRQDIDFAEEWKPIETELSKMEVLYYYIQAKNPTSYAILTDDEKGQFNKYEFDAMLDSLSAQEKMLGDVMQLAAEKYWNGLNAYHIKKYHTELGKVKGYFPRLSEQSEVKMLDMFNDYVNQSSTGKFQKQRTAGVGTRIASANALAVLFDHIEKANTVIIMGEHMDEVNRVFTNSDLKRLIQNTWGDDVTREFYGQLAGNLFTAQTLTKSLQEKWYGSVIGNLIKANIFFKPQIGFKQLISFMNYGKGDDYVSAKEWWNKFIKQTLTPSQWKKNIEFMMENDYLRDRFSRGGSMDALKKELDTRYFSKMSLFDEFWGMPVALGDISAIILGGKPYIDVLMEKGYTKEQAFRIFIETTVNDQQSSIPSTLSNMQRNATQSPLAKMAFAYQNTPWQYYRQCTSAIMNAVQSGKKADIQRAAKMTLLYGWLFPALFNMASSLSLLTAMGGGGDDDLLSDINPLRTITSVLTQHPILGQWINGILNAAEGKAFNSQDLLTKHINNINKLIRHTKKGGVTLEDLWNSVAAFGETFTGNPLSSMGNAASGVYDVIQGDVMKGALKVLGYTDYRAKKVTGEK